MPTNEELRRWDREVVWHAFTQMAEYEPLIVERGEGCTLIDIDGRRLIDGVSSLWCNVHGHRHPKIDAAVQAQLERIAHVTQLGMSSPTAIELAKRLVDITPDELSHVFFSDSGATAVEIAIKMAFQFWRQCEPAQPRKAKFLAYGQAYHGDTIGSVSVGGMPLFHEIFKPLLFEVMRLPQPGLYRRPEGVTRENACEYHLRKLEDVLKEQHEEIAGLIIEPLIQGAAGMVTHPPGYLRGVRELTRKYDVLLIADEVATGFGRTGKMFACNQEDVTPDILCLAKGLTGGYLPVAATVATRRVYEAFLGEYVQAKTFFHGHTYGGNPLGCAAALATLDVFEQEKTLENLPAKIARFEERLARIAEHPHVGDVRQRGLMIGVELVKDKPSKEPYPWGEKRGYRACDRATELGVWLRPLGNVMIVMPPLAISLDEIDQICDAVEAGVEAATRDS